MACSLAGGHVLISGDRLLGLLAHTAGMPDESAAHFEDALTFTDKAGYRLEAVWVGYDYAGTLLERAVAADSSTGSAPAIERAASRECHGITLETNEINTESVALYGKHGFSNGTSRYKDGKHLWFTRAL